MDENGESNDRKKEMAARRERLLMKKAERMQKIYGSYSRGSLTNY